MYQTINLSQFRDSFSKMDRKDQFSYEGLEALYDFLEEVEPDYDLGVIALCCKYTEYDNLEEFNNEHDPADSIEEIEERTTVIRVNDEGFIIAQY